MNDNPNEFRLESFPHNTTYELRIKGRISETTLAWFEDMTVEFDETTSPPQTVISGPMRDQAALYGCVNRIRDLGLVLLSINLVNTKEE